MHQDKHLSNNTLQRSFVKSEYILFWISVQSFSFVFLLFKVKNSFIWTKNPHMILRKKHMIKSIDLCYIGVIVISTVLAIKKMYMNWYWNCCLAKKKCRLQYANDSFKGESFRIFFHFTNYYVQVKVSLKISYTPFTN